MSIPNILKLLTAFLVLDNYVYTQRVSDLYCNDYSLVRTDPESIHPHLVEFRQTWADGFSHRYCPGILISKDFVLTSCLSGYPAQEIVANYKMRKASVIGDQQPNRQFYSIAQYIPFNTPSMKYPLTSIGLVQLSESISFHNSLSIFRPACLWTDAALPTTGSYLTYKNKGADLKTIRGRIIPENTCVSIPASDDVLRQTHMCLNLSGDHEELILPNAIGSSVEINVQNRNYVAGIVINRGANDFGIKISSIFSWIESVTWPDGYEQFFECGQRKVIHKPLITFSLPTYHGEYPWHVALYRLEGGRKNFQKYVCGGTIINKRTVMTAAHCVQNELGVLPASRLIVVAGIHNLNEHTGDTYNYVVQNIIVHDEYNRNYLENDIALVKLGSPITFSNYIQPICWSKNSDYNTMIGTVVGWGYNELHQPSDILLQANLPIRTNKECRASNREFFNAYLNDFNYCAGYQNGTNVCSGDSGGGMIFEHESHFYIKGIVSVGVALPQSNKCDITQMVLFTDVTKFYDWIKSNTDND